VKTKHKNDATRRKKLNPKFHVPGVIAQHARDNVQYAALPATAATKPPPATTAASTAPVLALATPIHERAATAVALASAPSAPFRQLPDRRGRRRHRRLYATSATLFPIRRISAMVLSRNISVFHGPPLGENGKEPGRGAWAMSLR